MTVAYKLRELRGSMSMDALSELLQVSKSIISLIEAGKRNPGVKTAKKLSKFSGKEINYWID